MIRNKPNTEMVVFGTPFGAVFFFFFFSGMLLRFSSLCLSKNVGSLESIYRRRDTKPFIEDVRDNFEHTTATAPEHLNIIPEDPSEMISDEEGMISI